MRWRSAATQAQAGSRGRPHRRSQQAGPHGRREPGAMVSNDLRGTGGVAAGARRVGGERRRDPRGAGAGGSRPRSVAQSSSASCTRGVEVV
jgi:hypothetical protein